MNPSLPPLMHELRKWTRRWRTSSLPTSRVHYFAELSFVVWIYHPNPMCPLLPSASISCRLLWWYLKPEWRLFGFSHSPAARKPRRTLWQARRQGNGGGREGWKGKNNLVLPHIKKSRLLGGLPSLSVKYVACICMLLAGGHHANGPWKISCS